MSSWCGGLTGSLLLWRRHKARRIEHFGPIARLEWQYRHHFCPVRNLSELPQLLDLRPFDRLQFLKVRNQAWSDPTLVDKAKLLSRMVTIHGCQKAFLQLNNSRNFWKTFKEVVSVDANSKEKLQQSYLWDLKRFLTSEGE